MENLINTLQSNGVGNHGNSNTSTPNTTQPGYTGWSISDIRRCKKYVTKLQSRIQRMVEAGKIRIVKKLTKLLMNSRAMKIVSIYNVVNNSGAKTAGVDGIALKGNKKAFMENLVNMVNWNNKYKMIRRVEIPKANGKTRPLGIPTIEDRIKGKIMADSIEPIVEQHFQDNSYGFRTHRSAQDAVAHLFIKLARHGSPKWVIEGDIKGCFDNIPFETVERGMEEMGVTTRIRKEVNEMLKVGIIHNGKITKPTKGTPQGGTISPILANIALHPIDGECKKTLVRYADDFINTCRTEEEAIIWKEKYKKWIKENIGVELSDEKTKITHIDEGFEFLGFNFKKYGEKLIIKPSEKKIKEFKKELADGIAEIKHIDVKSVITMTNKKLQGWSMYYRHVVSRKAFERIDSYVWKLMWQQLRRKHPERSAKWIRNKYIKPIKNNHWRIQDGKATLMMISNIPIKRFVKVKEGMKVHRATDRKYWSDRKYTNAYKQIYSKKMLILFTEQKGICPVCGEIMDRIEDTEVHHVIPRAKGGTDELINLKLLHQPCHKEITSIISPERMKKYIDQGIRYYECENYIRIIRSEPV